MGLLSGVLPAVYSASDALKRKVGGLLSDPVSTLQQHVGLLNDNARSFNQLHSKATQESVNSIKGGGSGFGPASQQLAGKLADAYNPMGMVVWHGSPHKFSKFDSSKIGMGEGAQAYGHGLYLAESHGVADGYRKKLSGVYDKDPVKHIDGITDAWNIGLAKQAIQKTDGDYEKAASWLRTLKPNAALSQEAIDRSIDAVAKKQVFIDRMGSLYKVDLPDDAIAKMLDWDKPLSQQAGVMGALKMDVGAPLEAIKEGSSWSVRNTATGEILSRNWGSEAMARKFAGLGGANAEANLTGQAYYKKLGESGDASSKLRELGIPGIRYLDGGSRGAGGGTSNFVVFPGNEGLLNILERNGKPLE